MQRGHRGAASPGRRLRTGVAENLPFGEAEFDATLACLVVGFMSNAHAGVLEMARVTRPGGTVAACLGTSRTCRRSPKGSASEIRHRSGGTVSIAITAIRGCRGRLWLVGCGGCGSVGSSGVVELGTAPRFAPMALAADAGNRAALYVLCGPAAGDIDELEQLRYVEVPEAGNEPLADASAARNPRHLRDGVVVAVLNLPASRTPTRRCRCR